MNRERNLNHWRDRATRFAGPIHITNGSPVVSQIQKGNMTYRARSTDIAAVKNGIETDGGILVECLS